MHPHQPTRLTRWLLLAALFTGCGAPPEGDSGDADPLGDTAPDRGPTLDLNLDAGSDTAGGQDAPGGDSGGFDSTAAEEPVESACGGLNQACCEQGACDDELFCQAGLCALGTTECPMTPSCPAPPQGEPDVPVLSLTGAPPTLAGGALVGGEFELTQVEIFGDETFSALVESVEVSSNGNTYGSLALESADWGFDANLDLAITLTALGQTVDQAFAQNLTGGGCYVPSANQLQGDVSECGGAWPEGATPPESLEFETGDSTLRILLLLTNETIMASIPEDQRLLAGLAITGDLPVLFTFTAIE